MSATLVDVVSEPSLTSSKSWLAQISSLHRLLLILAGTYAVTAALLLHIGFALPVPWGFLPFLCLMAFPLGYLLVVVNQALAGRLEHRSPVAYGLMPLLGVAVIWWFGYAMDYWIVLTVVCVAHLVLRRREALPRLASAMVVVFFGCGAMWNFNYLIAHWAGDRSIDPWLMQLDLWCYRCLMGPQVEWAGIFPIFRQESAYALLERSYQFYFVEFAAVLFLVARRGKEAVKFLTMLFAVYGIGVVVFALAPSIGPFTYYPECIDPAYHRTGTYSIMAQIIQEYEAVRTGAPLNGFGYFIALPSMHVAKALLLQLWLQDTPALFWMFLPANVLMALSTFLLGYHYIIDFPAGIVVTLIVVAACRRWWPTARQ